MPTDPTPAQIAALTLISRMVEIAPAYADLNSRARALQGDFASHHAAIDEAVYTQVVALIDAALGNDGIGSYFLHECQNMPDGGLVVEKDGTSWRLKTVDDLRAYVSRDHG